MSGLLGAVGFLTRIPVGNHPPEPTAAIPWFPIVGAIVGAAVAAVFVATGMILPSLLAATVAVTTGLVVTGALHEDGLADTADACGGAQTHPQALRILDDPTLGTYGVVALTISIVTRIGSIASLKGWTAVAVVAAAHALGRTSAVMLLAITPAVRSEGLGHEVRRSRARVPLAVVIGLGAAGILIGFWALPAAILAVVGTVTIRQLATHKIGGSSGDVAGAAEQVTEILVLLLGAAAVANAWPDPAWWPP